MRNCGTVEFFPAEIPFPKFSSAHRPKQAATCMVVVLSSTPSSIRPSLQELYQVCNILLQLVTTLKRFEHVLEPSESSVLTSKSPRVENHPFPSRKFNKPHQEPLDHNGSESPPTVGEDDIVEVEALQHGRNLLNNCGLGSIRAHGQNLNISLILFSLQVACVVIMDKKSYNPFDLVLLLFHALYFFRSMLL